MLIEACAIIWSNTVIGALLLLQLYLSHMDMIGRLFAMICHMSHAMPKCAFAVCVDSKGPDQTAHLRSLIRAFTVCCQNHWILQNVLENKDTYHTCHKLWTKIYEIRQNFKRDLTKICEIFLNITLELPQNSLKSFFSCEKLVKTRAMCDLCLFLNKICCKMVWKFCEIWIFFYENCPPDGSDSVGLYLTVWDMACML